MKKIVTVRFKDKTYDYLCDELVEVGDEVEVIVRKESITKTVEKVSYISEREIEYSNFDYKEAKVVKRNGVKLKDVLSKNALKALVEKVKELTKKPEDICVVKTHENYKPVMIIYSKGVVIGKINIKDEYPLELEKYYCLTGKELA